MGDLASKGMKAVIVAIVVVVAVVGIAYYLTVGQQPAAQPPLSLPSTPELVERARQEKTLVWYGPSDTPDMVGVVFERFKQTYPLAEVRYVENGTPEIVARVTTENRGGSPSADVFNLTFNGFNELKKQGMTAKIGTSKHASLYPSTVVDPEGGFVPFLGNLIVVIYNTNLVKGDDIPKSYSDLTKPIFKNKFALENPGTLEAGGILFGELYGVLGEEQWTRLMQGIAANDPIVVESASSGYEGTVRGEYLLSIVLSNDVAAQAPGTPVAIAWIDPAMIQLTVMGVNAKAPSPNLARLFAEWGSSPEGQRAIADTGRTPALPSLDVPSATGKLLPPGITIGFNKNPDFYINPNNWAQRFNDLFK